MKFGSLFSGIGGFDLGFERAGMSCEWQVEIDSNCQKVLADHWPSAERIEDVREAGRSNLAAVDLICGGFPCQDVSVAGNRAGIAGERSGLWFEFHRVLAELRPRWTVIENVPGLLSSNGGRDFAVILRGMEELGYRVAWRVLDAQFFGVPQRRRRVFLIGSLGDYRSIEVLFEPESLQGNSPKSRKAGEDIAPTLASRSRGGGGLGTDAEIDGALALSPMNNNIAASLLASGAGTSRPAGIASKTDFLVFQQNQRNELRITNDKALPLESRMAQAYWDGGQITDTLDKSQLEKQQMMPEKRRFPAILEYSWKSQYTRNGRGAPVPLDQAIAPTLCAQSGQTGKGDGAPLVGVRRLMPLECERLQGFPDGWTEGHSDTARYRMLGNAVAVPVAEWIAKRIANLEP